MPAILRYHTVSPVAISPVIMSFPTEAGLKAFCQTSLPADARGIDMWWEDDTPKQPATCRPEWHKPSAWEQETGKPLPIITCPIEITSTTRNRRRMAWDYIPERSAKAQREIEALITRDKEFDRLETLWEQGRDLGDHYNPYSV